MSTEVQFSFTARNDLPIKITPPSGRCELIRHHSNAMSLHLDVTIRWPYQFACNKRGRDTMIKSGDRKR